jgi:transposase
MGHRQVEQAALFYEFSLEKHVPPDHLLRSIDRFVELDEVRRELAGFYSHLGRPSIDPELMIRMLIVGYCFGIRSERRLCEEVHLNLAYFAQQPGSQESPRACNKQRKSHCRLLLLPCLKSIGRRFEAQGR